MIPVRRLWPCSTIVCIGGGPSLTQADVDAVRGRARVVAINDAYRLAPWADVLYAADRKWIDWHDGVPGFAGPKYSIESQDPTPRPDWTVLRNTGPLGLELLNASGLRAGFNSGYQAIGLAVHFGAARIVLLGYDMGPSADGRSHWFGDHPDGKASPYPQMIAAFDTLAVALAECGVSVVNCSRRTALTTFQRRTLEDVFAKVAAA
jgi:hypothetical protein